MIYYWIVKHEGFEGQNIFSHQESFSTLQSHHITILSVSPLLSGASFAPGLQIKTERTWRDLNNTLVKYLQSPRVRDDGEQSPLGINIGTIVAFKNPPPKTRGGIL